MKPILAITMGDINGVGPEVLAKALANDSVRSQCRPLVVGSAAVLDAAREYAPECPELRPIDVITNLPESEDLVPVLDGGFKAPERRPGQLDPEAGRCAVEWVKLAVRLGIDKHIEGIVTCPINKEGIHRAGYDWAGHTDLIAGMTNTTNWRMGLFADAMRAVHLSAHVSLANAVNLVRNQRVATTIKITDDALGRLGLKQRRIAVAGLNPHAGESGAFGREETEQILPAIRASKADGIDCSGPYPPDTVFSRMKDGEFDAVVAMYHDQGHGPLKTLSIERGVNVTLGIPIVRTSVGHGTAYEIAGTGEARETSLCCAIDLAAQLAAGGKGGNP